MDSAYELVLERNIIRGDDWEGIEFTIDKVGVDYTGATIKVQFRTMPDKAVIVEKTPDPSVAIADQIKFIVSLTKDDTALMNSRVIYADVEITTTVVPSVKTPILLKLNVTKDITKI